MIANVCKCVQICTNRVSNMQIVCKIYTSCAIVCKTCANHVQMRFVCKPCANHVQTLCKMSKWFANMQFVCKYIGRISRLTSIQQLEPQTYSLSLSLSKCVFRVRGVGHRLHCWYEIQWRLVRMCADRFFISGLHKTRLFNGSLRPTMTPTRFAAIPSSVVIFLVL